MPFFCTSTINFSLRRQNVIKAAVFVYHNNIRLVWDAWKKYTCAQKLKQRKSEIANQQFSLQLLQKAFIYWRHRTKQVKYLMSFCMATRAYEWAIHML